MKAPGPDAADLFATHYGRLAGWLRRLVDDDEAAHELAGEAFTRILGRWSKIDDPVGYLYVVGANLVREHWRRTARRRGAIRALVDNYPRSTAVASSSTDIEMRMLVQKLPAPQRIAVLLHYYADIPVADVARLTNRPPGTVKSDLSRARTSLRAALSDQSGQQR